jgi:hypothetical protein
LVDGGKARMILPCLVTPSDVAENPVVLDQFRRTLFRRKLRPERLVAAATSATGETIRAVEAQGGRAPRAATAVRSRARARGATKDAWSAAPVTPRIATASVATEERPPTRKHAGNPTSGLSRCSLRPSSGTVEDGASGGTSST